MLTQKRSHCIEARMHFDLIESRNFCNNYQIHFPIQYFFVLPAIFLSTDETLQKMHPLTEAGRETLVQRKIKTRLFKPSGSIFKEQVYEEFMTSLLGNIESLKLKGLY